jgi:hypothetical protein
LAAGVLLTAYSAVSLTPQLLDDITSDRAEQRGYAEGAFFWGVMVYFCGALIHRLLTAGPTLPTFEVGLAGGLRAFALGWGLGVTILSARVIGDSLRHFGEPPRNGSYLADVFFFVLTALIISTPGLVTAVLAKWLR